MNETTFIDDLIKIKQLVVIRLLEGRDISAIPVSHDAAAIIVKKKSTKEISLIYKKAISVITPSEGLEETNEQPTVHGRIGDKPEGHKGTI